MATSNSQINKPQAGRAKRVKLPDVNINTGAQRINTERVSKKIPTAEQACYYFHHHQNL